MYISDGRINENDYEALGMVTSETVHVFPLAVAPVTVYCPLVYPSDTVFSHQPLAAVVAVISRFLYTTGPKLYVTSVSSTASMARFIVWPEREMVVEAEPGPLRVHVHVLPLSWNEKWTV